MESLLMSIALQYGKGKITEAGLNYAAKVLGIDQQPQLPKYAISMGGQTINPINMLKRSALNTGIKSLFGSSSMLPLGLGAGAIYLLNKNREKLTGYKTQADYEAARDRRIANKRLDKITDRIINDKNYGNYEEALLDSDAGAIKIDDKVMYQTDYFPEPTPKKKTYSAPTGQDIHGDGGNGGGGGGGNPTGSPGSKGPGGSDEMGSFARGGRALYSRGGIASLKWQR